MPAFQANPKAKEAREKAIKVKEAYTAFKSANTLDDFKAAVEKIFENTTKEFQQAKKTIENEEKAGPT